MKNKKILSALLIVWIGCLKGFGAENCKLNIKNINSSCNVEFAEVKKIIDGDTIHLYTGEETIKTRLYGIDCMETAKIHRAYKQAYQNKISIEKVIKQGNLAASELENLIKDSGYKVYFKTLGIDQYGRLLAVIYDKNFENLNRKMIKTGFCPVYKFKGRKPNLR